jgi:CheY-like chemotaxis protein
MKLILLEDEPLILLCAQDALTAAGFEVIPATNGEEALQLLPQTADCVLMMVDVRLGGELNGWEVARRARKVQPDLAIVYTTTADGPAYRRESVDRSVLLQKPYNLDRAVSAARDACQMIQQGHSGSED